MNAPYDSVVIGSGPNGLSAAIHLAGAGRTVFLAEAKDSPGGGARTAALTLPGFQHDSCSAVHPLAVASPFFATLGLADLGLHWIHPPTPLAHAFPDGGAVTLERDLDATAAQLGPDAGAYRDLMRPLVESWEPLLPFLLGPLLRVPRHPVPALRFARSGLRSATGLARSRFRGREARGLFAGLAAHSMLSLDRTASAAVGLVLGMAAHAVGWPFPRSGAGAITSALVSRAEGLGVRLETNLPIGSLEQLPPARAYLFDVTPRQLLSIGGTHLPERYRRRLARYRYGPGVFKIDWALSEPIPWTHPACRRSGTVHLGGGLPDVVRSEGEVAEGMHPEEPFVILTQPSLFDPSRAPRGRHTAWAYCHVPHGSSVDMTGRIERRIEQCAPGFLDVILARHTLDVRDLEAMNPNYVGGDIGGGANDLRQVFARPTLGRRPYATPDPRVFLCSASTPPGGGVHGMCGFHAAGTVLEEALH